MIHVQVHMLILFSHGQIISSPEPEESEVKSSLLSPEPVQPPSSSGVIASQLVALQVQ